MATSTTSLNAITFNYRDIDYSASNGGYHPVEIRTEKVATDRLVDYWQVVYITDFSYQGFPNPELVKEIDVCFVTNQVYSLYGGDLNIYQGRDLLKVFISNFIEYHKMGTYKVSVTSE